MLRISPLTLTLTMDIENFIAKGLYKAELHFVGMCAFTIIQHVRCICSAYTYAQNHITFSMHNLTTENNFCCMPTFFWFNPATMQRILVNICCTTSCCPMSLRDNCTGLLCFLMPCSWASNEFLSLFHYIPPWYQFKCIFSLTQLRPLLALWGFVTSMYVTVYMTVYDMIIIWYDI